jgi:hypothetical protein
VFAGALLPAPAVTLMPMTRFVIDAPTLLHLVAQRVPVSAGHQLVAPRLLRSQVLALLFEAVQRASSPTSRRWTVTTR